MLYVSSRNRTDTYTAFHTLQKDTCSGGGRYIPVRIPVFTAEQLMQLREKSFGQCVADVLNLFFTARLDAKDVDFSIGKRPVQISRMSHKILIAEAWHNPTGLLRDSVHKLVQRLLGSGEAPPVPTGWARTAVWIAFLFGIYAEILRTEKLGMDGAFDVAVSATDFFEPMAVWYARKMGLPIRTVVCGCDDGGALWDLMNHGTASGAEQLDPDVERLIFHTLGQEEVDRFASACESGKPYHISEEQCAALQAGFFTAVVSNKRMESVISSVYRTNAYVLDASSALGFGGLQDYRTGAGETVPALILMNDSPASVASVAAKALGVSASELQQILNRS